MLPIGNKDLEIKVNGEVILNRQILLECIFDWLYGTGDLFLDVLDNEDSLDLTDALSAVTDYLNDQVILDFRQYCHQIDPILKPLFNNSSFITDYTEVNDDEIYVLFEETYVADRIIVELDIEIQERLLEIATACKLHVNIDMVCSMIMLDVLSNYGGIHENELELENWGIKIRDEIERDLVELRSVFKSSFKYDRNLRRIFEPDTYDEPADIYVLGLNSWRSAEIGRYGERKVLHDQDKGR